MGGTTPGTVAPVFPTNDHLDCVPETGTNGDALVGAAEWACGLEDINCDDMPNNCRNGEKFATWAFSQYYEVYKDQGGTCEFKTLQGINQAYLTDAPSHPECVFGYTGPEPETTTKPPATNPPAYIPDGRVCQPKANMNPKGPTDWACNYVEAGQALMDCNEAPKACSSGEGLATWAFSNYMSQFGASGARCDFGGSAELTENPRLPHCVYGYTGAQPQATTTAAPPLPIYPGTSAPGTTDGTTTPPESEVPTLGSSSEKIFGMERNMAMILFAGLFLVILGLCFGLVIVWKCCSSGSSEVVVKTERRGRKKRHRRDSSYNYQRYSTQV